MPHSRCSRGTISVLPSPEFRPLCDEYFAIVRLAPGAYADRHSVDILVSAFVARASQLQISVPANVLTR
jgi:hypothetical protein